MKKTFKKLILSSTITSVLLQPLSAYAWFGSSVALPNQLPFSNGTYPLMPANAALHATLAPGYKPFDEKSDGSLWRDDPAALFRVQSGVMWLYKQDEYFHGRVGFFLDDSLGVVIANGSPLGCSNDFQTDVTSRGRKTFSSFSRLDFWVNVFKRLEKPVTIADAALIQFLTDSKNQQHPFVKAVSANHFPEVQECLIRDVEIVDRRVTINSNGQDLTFTNFVDGIAYNDNFVLLQFLLEDQDPRYFLFDAKPFYPALATSVVKPINTFTTSDLTSIENLLMDGINLRGQGLVDGRLVPSKSKAVTLKFSESKGETAENTLVLSLVLDQEGFYESAHYFVQVKATKDGKASIQIFDKATFYKEVDLRSQEFLTRADGVQDLQERAKAARDRNLKRIAAFMASEDAHRRLVATDPAVDGFVVSQVVAAALQYLVNKQTPQGQLQARLSLHPRSARPTLWEDLLIANDYGQSYGVYGFAPLALLDAISRHGSYRFARGALGVTTLRHAYPWLRLPAYGLRYGMLGTSVLGAAAEGVELYRWKAGAMRNALRSAYSREPQKWADAITKLEQLGLPTLSALNTLGFALKVNEGFAPVATLLTPVLTPVTMLGKGGLALWSSVTAPFHWLYLGFLPKMVEWPAATMASGLVGTAGLTGGTIGAVAKNIPSATPLYVENMLAGAVSKARGEKAISLSSHVLGATLTGLSWGSSIPLSRTFSRHAPSAAKHLASLSPFITTALWQLSPTLLAQVPDFSDTRAVESFNDLTSWLAKRYGDELRYFGF